MTQTVRKNTGTTQVFTSDNFSSKQSPKRNQNIPYTKPGVDGITVLTTKRIARR